MSEGLLTGRELALMCYGKYGKYHDMVRRPATWDETSFLCLNAVTLPCSAERAPLLSETGGLSVIVRNSAQSTDWFQCLLDVIKPQNWFHVI